MKIPKARKLPSGSWFIQLRIDGRSVPITQPTEEKCEAMAMAVKAGLLEEEKRPLDISVSKAYDRYIESKDGVLSPSTVAGYKRLRKNTFSGIMKTTLSSLSNEKIQREISKMSKDGKSQKYIRNAEGLLSAVLKSYYPEFRLSVFLPQKDKIQPRRISDEEIAKIMSSVAGMDIELPVLMALWMGMRMSEIRGARYGDITGGTLHVCRAIVDDIDGNAVEKPPKTFSGDRWIDIPAYIAGLMGKDKAPTDHLVTLSAQAIYKRFVRMLENRGIPHCRFHDLRHANAAVMVRLGIESKYAQERNGWSSDRMYKQTYAYTMDDAMSEANGKINSYFANKIANGF